MTKYCSFTEDGSHGGGNPFIPITVEEAKKWSEDHMEVDEYISVFGPVEE